MQSTIDISMLEAFITRLSHLDWTYDYSDDVNVWRRGSASMSQAKQVASQRPQLAKAFHIYSEYVWGTGALQTRILERDVKLCELREEIKAAQDVKQALPLAA